jgi:hypothetical protein
MNKQDTARLDALADRHVKEWTVDDFRIVVEAIREAPPSIQEEAMAILRGERRAQA